LAADASDTVAWTVTLVLGIVLLAIFTVLVPLTPNRIWRRVRRQFEVRTLRVSEQGIRRITADNDSLMRWSMFSNTLQRGQMYLRHDPTVRVCFRYPGGHFDLNQTNKPFSSWIGGLLEQILIAARLSASSPRRYGTGAW
jgi:hypothetical protein